MKKSSRKLLSISGATLLVFGATSAAATGNLMAQPPKEKPAKDTADAGTPAPKETPKKDEKKK